ncbi:MAG: hypothetical protein RLZZ384_673 [Pseudomonadota bacterium]|jgi:hypothetical protein
MAIEYKKSLAVLTDFVGVEEAENLLQWLLKNPKGKINLAGCMHIHAANLQVFMAVKPQVSVWPADEEFKRWLAILEK